MFDSNKIVKVWDVSFQEDKLENSNAFLGFSPFIEYHVTNGYWIVLQTEKDYISIGADGVNKYDAMPFNSDDYDVSEVDFIDGDETIESLETTLFVGEKLLEVNHDDDRFILVFDDFTMYLYPRESKDFRYDADTEDFPIKGFERHITRKCECGGEPELMSDFASDFYIRCSKCHKITMANFELRSVIEAWNNSEIVGVFDTSAESFFKHIHEPIKYIALDEHSIDEEMFWDCNSVIIAIGNAFYKIESQRVAEDTYDFKFNGLLDYNREMWPFLVKASDEEPIEFVRFEREPELNAVMRLNIGNRPILITADISGVMIGISHCGLNDEWLEFDNNVLVNAKQG